MPGTDATIPSDATDGDAPSAAYARVPTGATRGVVVIHEIFGRQPDIDRVVDRFATRGYAAVAPDLFHEGALRCIRAVFSGRRPRSSRPSSRPLSHPSRCASTPG
jgi:carboxymethylenebutenolidase